MLDITQLDEFYEKKDIAKLEDILTKFYWSYYQQCGGGGKHYNISQSESCYLCDISRIKYDDTFRKEIVGVLSNFDIYKYCDSNITFICSKDRMKNIFNKINFLLEEKKNPGPIKTVIVNIVGGPCSGKSTLACELFVYLKKVHANVEYVPEFAKKLVWENNIESLNDQYYVSNEQYKIIKNVYNKVEYIVCDSPLILGLFYNYYNTSNMSDTVKTSQMIMSKIDEFENNFYIFIKRNKALPYINSGRVNSEEEYDTIEAGLLNLLKEQNIKYMTITTGDDSIKNIIKEIVKLSYRSYPRLNNEGKIK